MTKLALIIGINYIGDSHELQGCINDTIELNKLLTNKFNYKMEDITTMTDNKLLKLKPTCQNILDNLNLFVNKINNDNITEAWFSFSGHGSYILDKNNDELDGYDECIIPIDYKKNVIIDDEMNNIFSKITNSKCKLICMFDCCHSGTMCDLPYRCNIINQNKLNKVYIKPKTNYKKTIKCEILSISGCLDNQTSADFFINNEKRWAGALTTSFIQCINSTKLLLNYNNLVINLNKYMIDNEFQQRPLLCSNKYIKPNMILYFNKDTINSFIN